MTAVTSAALRIPTAPIRTCVGCRSRAPVTALVRLVWDEASGQVVVDQARCRPGRGAWLHHQRACAERAVARRAIARALRRPVSETATAALEEAAALWPPDGSLSRG